MFMKGDLITLDHNLKGCPYFNIYPDKNTKHIKISGFIKNETLLVVEVSTNIAIKKITKRQ